MRQCLLIALLVCVAQAQDVDEAVEAEVDGVVYEGNVRFSLIKVKMVNIIKV